MCTIEQPKRYDSYQTLSWVQRSLDIIHAQFMSAFHDIEIKSYRNISIAIIYRVNKRFPIIQTSSLKLLLPWKVDVQLSITKCNSTLPLAIHITCIHGNINNHQPSFHIHNHTSLRLIGACFFFSLTDVALFQEVLVTISAPLVLTQQCIRLQIRIS